MYEFVRGPLVWAGFIVFFGGMIYRLIAIAFLSKKDKVVYPYIRLRFGLRSVIRWLTPYGTVNMRMRPVFTFLSFLFHVCLLATPIFALGHVMSWKESWGVSWWTLPDGLTNVMTIIVVLTGLMFVLRRIADPAVRFVTSFSDFIIIAVVLAPFITGLMAYYQVFDYEIVITAHMVTGAVFLMVIPFTRLVHMMFFPLTRAYMGSEFGYVRNAKDW
jgi:nitrate reductase gamma subunit